MSKNEASIALLKSKIDVTKYEEYRGVLQDLSNQALDVYTGNTNIPFEFSDLDEIHDFWLRARSDLDAILNMSRNNQNESVMYSDESWDQEDDKFKLHALSELARITYYNGENAHAIIGGHEDDIENAFQHLVIDSSNRIQLATFPISQLQEEKDSAALHVLKMHLQRYEGLVPRVYNISLNPPEAPLLPEEEPIFWSIKKYSEGFSHGQTIHVENVKFEEEKSMADLEIELTNKSIDEVLTDFDHLVTQLNEINNDSLDIFLGDSDQIISDEMIHEVGEFKYIIREELDRMDEMGELGVPAFASNQFKLRALESLTTNAQHNAQSANASHLRTGRDPFIHTFRHTVVNPEGYIDEAYLALDEVRKAKGTPEIAFLRETLLSYSGELPYANDVVAIKDYVQVFEKYKNDLSIEKGTENIVTDEIQGEEAISKDEKQSNKLEPNSVGIVKMKLNDKGHGVATVQYGEITLNNIRVVDSNGIPNVYPPSVKGKDDKYYPVFEL
ncbi:hypothetical protein HCA68_15370, partial [Listeria booriae]|uniref:hypothetical protein n=2 Tax=Listeria booriae TaxID=1552123 RepID=UPI001623FE4D